MLCLLTLLMCASLGQAPVEVRHPRAEDLFLQARQHFEKQEWEKARADATKALQVNPRLVDAEVMLGLIASIEGKFSSAEQRFLRAISLQPQNDLAQGYLASTYLQQKRYPEAARAFKKVLSRNPKNQAANYNLGLIALVQEKPTEARAYFEQVRRQNPDDIPALTGILECQLLLKQSDEARQLTANLERLLPAQDPRLFQIATMLALYQQYDPAIAILERVRQVYPQSRDVNYNLALSYLRSGKYDRAAQVLEPLLSQPGAADAYSLLAQAQEKLQHREQALLGYQRAAELEPGNEDYRFDHAYALLRYVPGDAATTAFSMAARDFPKSWRMRVGLGSAYFLAGRSEEAAAALLEALELEPAAKVAYYLLGKAYEAAGDEQAAIREAFKSYLEKDPRDPWAYHHYGTMLFLQAQAELTPDFEVAKSYLDKALALNPDLAEAHVQMGIIAQAEGRLPESVRSLEKASRINPNLPTSHYRLAQVYQQLGDKEKSKAEFDLVEKLRAIAAAQEKQEVVQSLSGQNK
jgi:tetratricopeptide (TPR) repeat protein